MDYKQTLNLPQTEFSMKANLAQKEPEMVSEWQNGQLRERIEQKNEQGPRFILHDGPPYANGHIHMGHALNKVLKDIVIKYKSMRGYYAPYVPGWDCHGLPIEHQVTTQLKKEAQNKTTLDIRKLCREYALKFVELQKEEFQRLGILGHWDKPYLTMNYDYEAATVELFGLLAKKGYIEKGLKPIHWCMSCVTALAEAEIEYADHQSLAVHVKMKALGDWSGVFPGLPDKPLSIMIWTTTPWTLPANLAVAVHPDFNYVAVDVGNEIVVLTEKLVESAMQQGGVEQYRVLQTVRGQQLAGLTYAHPFMEKVPGLDQDRAILLADFVTDDDGTGCVHIAPGHGEDDFRVGLAHGLPVFAPVNAYGQLTEDVPLFAGQKVFVANSAVVETLQQKGVLWAQNTIHHSYPHCWRCKKAVIFRATEQWFINVDHEDLRHRVQQAIKRVNWIPVWGETRISEMVKNRPNWCISRQRSWGVPIPVLYCEGCQHTILDDQVIAQVAQAVKKGGCDVWYEQDVAQLVPNLRCPQCQGTQFRKESDILDVWFDSGASHYAVLKQQNQLAFPAQLYLEGSDQHRGWFQSSIFLAMAGVEQEPFESILTHGFVVDGQGKKMSKSVGNVVSPQDITKQYGADIVRLFVSSADYTDDIRISEDIIKQKVDAYRKIRNTCRYLLSNSFDFNPLKDVVAYDDLLEIDRWALSRLNQLIARVTDMYDQYQIHKVYSELYHFCTVDMSAFYLDILKDRLYVSGPKSIERRSAQTVLMDICNTLVKLMAPIMPFTSEEVWRHRYPLVDSKEVGEESVHLSVWPETHPQWNQPDLNQSWQVLQDIRNQVLKAIEPLRGQKEIGSSLEVGVELKVGGQTWDLLQRYQDQLPMIFIVSDVKLTQTSEDSVQICVNKLNKNKCIRCWVFSDSVGRCTDHPELCERCAQVINQCFEGKEIE